MKTLTEIIPEIIDEAKTAGCENAEQINGFLAAEVSRLRNLLKHAAAPAAVPGPSEGEGELLAEAAEVLKRACMRIPYGSHLNDNVVSECHKLIARIEARTAANAQGRDKA